MLLHGRVIFYLLSKEYPCNYEEVIPDYPVRGPIFYDENEDMADYLIVLKDTGTGLKDLKGVRKSILVCTEGTAGLEGLDSIKSNTIVIQEDIPVEKVFNSLLRIFTRFSEWEGQMKEMVQQMAYFSDIIGACDDFIEEPMSLTDSQYNYVAYTQQLSKERGFVDRFVTNNRVSIDVVQKLKAMPDYEKSKKMSGVYDYMADEHFFVKNILFRGEFAGQLVIPVTDNPDLNAYHRCFLGYIGDYIEELYQRCGTFYREWLDTSKFKFMLIDLLNERIIEMDLIRNILNESGMLQGDVYYLIQFKLHFSRETDSYLTYLKLQLEVNWPGSIGFEYDGRLFLLINESKEKRMRVEDSSKKLPYFLRETLLLAGMSRKFTDILQVKAAYRQTEIALEYGYVKNPTFWYFKFDDYAFDYLIENGRSSFQPKNICSNSIILLREHDEQHQTEYFKTVYHFIKSKYNASATAKSLYIARSSFLNRMARITELTGIDWDDMDTRLYIELSCRILGEES